MTSLRTKGYYSTVGRTEGQGEPGTMVTNLGTSHLQTSCSINNKCPDGIKLLIFGFLLLETEHVLSDSVAFRGIRKHADSILSRKAVAGSNIRKS